MYSQDIRALFEEAKTFFSQSLDRTHHFLGVIDAKEQIAKNNFRLLDYTQKKTVHYEDGHFIELKSGRLRYLFEYNGKQTSVIGETRSACFLKRQTIEKNNVLPKKSGKKLYMNVWLTQYFDCFVPAGLDPFQRELYRTVIQKDINPVLGNLGISEVTPKHIQSLLDELADPMTKKLVTQVLFLTFIKAQESGRITFNPILI